MAKVKYKFNPQTLNYEKIQLTLKDYLKRAFSVLLSGIAIAFLILLVGYTLFDSPKELMLKRENEQLLRQYKMLNEQLAQMERVLSSMEQRDDNIYRTIFEAEPIGSSVRQAGVGGVNRYEHLEGYQFSDVVVETTYKLDKLAKRMYIQSKSFDEIVELARNKEKLINAIPAIQPVTNENLTRMTSGFGYRIDPIYKTTKFHAGIDFAAPIGTPIYATGDGVVEKAVMERGYGLHVIVDHGYNYSTLYGHMSKIMVRRGQRVKRGDVIGLVGNTGKSSGPHIHYEVRKDGTAVNPVNYFFNDLTPDQYQQMIELSSQGSQSFD